MSAKISLKKYLNELSKEELIKEVEKLSKKFKNVNEHYEAELSTDTSGILSRYKQAIFKEFFPKGKNGNPGRDPRASVLRKIISDFSKIAVFEVDIIELILFRVETAVDYTNEYGDVDEQFYTSAENYFDKVCVMIAKNKLQAEYETRCMTMIHKTEDFGWGFFDTLHDSWSEHCKQDNGNKKAKLDK